MRKECRFCGSGGQGIILAGLILAEAAGIFEGKCVVQVQDYGPAARGDSSKTDIIISDGKIDYPKCSRIDLLVALSQPAYDANKAYVKEGAVVIVDSNNVRLARGEKARRFPMTEIARDQVGSLLSVNMVALGIVAGLTDIVSLESVEKSMLDRVPDHTKEKNLAALAAGYEFAKRSRKTRKNAR